MSKKTDIMREKFRQYIEYHPDAVTVVIEDCGMKKYIKLTNGLKTWVDEEDYEELAQHRWYMTEAGYVERYKGKHISMHREIMQPPDDMMIDHINQDKLDNRRANLRVVTNSQNQMNAKLRADNTSGYKGVSWMKARGKWQAHVKVDGVKQGIGRFDTAEEADAACRKAREELHGEFARHE